MRPRPGRRGGRLRLLLALGVAAFALISYYSSSEYNDVTGEKQYLSITPRQEIALGLHAVPQMLHEYGGETSDKEAQDLVDVIGKRLVLQSDARDTEWPFEFHLLADPTTVNAFALPGGQVFITESLYRRLETRGQLAGVLAHEIGHVVARHSAQRIAQQSLSQGLIGAIILGSDGGQGTAQATQGIAQMIGMKYGRDDELQSDELGVRFMSQAGFDPNARIGVMEILAEASGGSQRPEFASTHPSPENRTARIRQLIQLRFPAGVSEGLER
jgi:predicted Zn-dependent protease